MKTNSKSTDKMIVLTSMLLELKDQLSEVTVEWIEFDDGNESVVVPNFELTFKDGETTSGVFTDETDRSLLP